jgi:hypothetical protein
MSVVSAARERERADVGGLHLTTGTLVAAALAVLVAQLALAIPAVLNGLFQQDLGTTSSQLTWISDAFLVPVTLLELTCGWSCSAIVPSPSPPSSPWPGCSPCSARPTPPASAWRTSWASAR